MKSAALVIGAGVAGIQVALDLAAQGFKVYVVEKNPSIGGRVAQLSKTFPEFECAACTLTPKMLEVERHPNIKLLTYSEIKNVRREKRSFKVKIQKKPKFVDESKCTGCGVCAQHCPIEVANDFDERIGVRSAIYIPSPNAVPLVYTIDKEHCLRCELCQNVCANKAVNLEQRPENIEIDVGAIVIATGYDPFDVRKHEEYGFGKSDNVLTGLALERLLTLSGPTGGHVLRLSDGRIPRKVAFVQCVGPRNKDSSNLYCSKVCCMYATKMAAMLKEQIPEAEITIYHPEPLVMDNGLDEFYQEAQNKFGVKYLKARIKEVVEKPPHNLLLRAVNAESGRMVEDEADMVVLSTGLVPAVSDDLALMLSLQRGVGSFFESTNPETDTVTTNVEGVFLAGVAEGPKSIMASVQQAHAAAFKASGVLKKLEAEASSSIRVSNKGGDKSG